LDEKKEFDEIVEIVLGLLEEKKYTAARKELLLLNAVDIAEVMREVIDEISLDAAIIAFRMLPKDISVDVFSYMSTEDQVEIINGITDREINYIIDELDFDDKIDVLEELPANLVDKILEKTPRHERKQINTFLNYPENCAGALMTPDYISLRRDMTVRQAMDYIKKVGMDRETIYTCYIKDEGRKLQGIVSLRTLVISDDDMHLSEIIREDVVSVNVYEDQEEVSEMFQRYGFLAIPVVDNEDRIVGIVTMDDIFEVIEEETTEDIERMAGVVDSTTTEYLDTPVSQQVKSRLPWLFFLMLSYIATGAIISHFEMGLQAVICLVAYMPMLMGTGGNSGSQSATLIIRSIGVGDLDVQDFLRVLWKEFRVSAIIGICLSLFTFFRVFFEQRNDPDHFAIALTVSFAMLLIVVIAKCIGGMLPLLAKKIGIDPALMASPMIASMTDMVSVTTYFTLATIILGI
jgi:magnesium transporter